MEENQDELNSMSDAKVMMGLRLSAKTKLELCAEADDLGITLSEHSENILLNRHTVFEELLKARSDIEGEQKKLEELKLQFQHFKAQHFDITENYKMRLQNKLTEISELNAALGLYADARLLQLFAGVHGKKDEIENADGENFEVTYNSPKDLLTAMIYSYELKKQ
jgi:hypothetical protein